MKKLNALNLGKSLGREEMKNISGARLGSELDPYCTCGKKPRVLTYCDCAHFCDGTCSNS